MFYHQLDNSLGNVYNAYTYKNAHYELHFHKAFEFIYQIDGEMQVTANEKSYTLKKGEALLFPPYTVHSLTSSSDNNCFIVVFSAQYAQTATKLFVEKSPEDFKFCFDKNTEKILLSDFIGNSPIDNPYFKVQMPSLFLLKSFLYSIFHHFLTQNPLTQKRSNPNLVQRVLEFIEKYYTEEITLKEIAVALHYNYDYLSRVFNQTFQIPFKKFLNQYRLERAVYLLQSTDKSITDIALESGFQSIRSFNRIFQNTFNLPPSKYLHR